jgi:hypothetical protein
VRLTGRRRLTRHPHTGVWFRAVFPHFFADGLGYAHSVTTPTRFNPGPIEGAGFPILYFAEDPQVALFEARAVFATGLSGRPVVPNPLAAAQTVFPVRVELGSVVDLCDPEQLQRIDTSVQELTGDWRGYRERPRSGTEIPLAPTQRLGVALAGLRGLEGFLTYSAHAPTRRNLVVFPAKLRRRSRIEITDPATGQVSLRLP